MKQILCIYHRSDLDGIGSAAIAYSVFKNSADYVGLEYGDKFDPKIIKGKKLVIMDFSLKDAYNMDDAALDCSELIWLDHHKTAQESFSSLWKNAEGKRSIEKSAVRLTWEYFYPKKKIPECVLLIEDYDIWKFRHRNTKAFNIYASTAIKSFDDAAWKKLLKGDKKIMKEWLLKGECLLEAEAKRIDKAREFVIERKIWGRKVGLVNSINDASVLGNALVNDGFEVAVVWKVVGTGKVGVSLRSKGPVDVSEIAKKYGGGGHRNAAGFTMGSVSEFSELFGL